jgi:23S rRNA pseudouridine1911/1915/1917 synthase
MEPTRLSVEQPGLRLDQFIVQHLPDLSRTEVQRLIKAGDVQVNEQLTKPAYRVEAGDVIDVLVPEAQEATIEAEAIPLEIIYEDDDVVAINKPAGMVVHPAYGNTSGTLVNAALSRWPQMKRITGEDRAGIIHRLDKDTSGVIVLAKTSAALKSVQGQFKARTVSKTYIALVDGIPPTPTGVIDAAIGRDPRQRKQMGVVRNGRKAVTHYTIIETFDEHALLKLEPQTGRTHQLRVHLKWLGYPIVADKVYGRRKVSVICPRMFLHAVTLEIDSPSTGARLHFSAPLPGELEEVMVHLRKANLWETPENQAGDPPAE